MSIRKGYTDGPFGQIHWRELSPTSPSAAPLFCFHPAPFSGLAFTGIMPFLSNKRAVIAPDYPGYGGSAAGDEPATIEKFADAMMAVIDDLTPNQEVDILGFHTGCFVAGEICARGTNRIRRAVLIDVPAFDQDKRNGFMNKLGPLALTKDFSCIEDAWASGVAKRLESQPMARAFEMFVEQLRPGEKMNDAFSAAFSYPWEGRLAEINMPTLVMATQSPLREASLAAAAAIPSCNLVERSDIKRAVLDEAAEKTAAEVNRFLDEGCDHGVKKGS